MSRSFVCTWVVSIGMACCLFACAAPPELVFVTAEGRRPTVAQMDEDPWRLLPPGAIVWWSMDARRLSEGPLGPAAEKLIEDTLPIVAGTQIQFDRDIDLVVAAVYATVGSDVVAICRGRFDKEAVETSWNERSKSEVDGSVQVLSFAGFRMSVAGQAALAILTDNTMVLGTQLGVRRVLEQVEEGRLARHLPSWYDVLLATPGADFQLGLDLDSQPVPAVLRERFAFLRGLRAARVIGNYQSPGLNLAGTLSYYTPAYAQEASVALGKARDQVDDWTLLMSAFNVTNPIVRLESRPTGKDTQVIGEFRGEALAPLLEQLSAAIAAQSGGSWLLN